MYKRGLQAEVYIGSSYLHTLQAAYAAEKGRFIGFPHYGAPQKGVDFCAQPEGAVELGFLISGCHDLRASPPRYTFRVEELESIKPSYRMEAGSGSDSQSRSLVCFDALAEEIWVGSQKKDISLMKSCW
jgi:hypothetical protein